jgi:glycosyltransferase involved in cell wall biosynthesis
MQHITQIIRAKRQGGIEQVAYHYAASLGQNWRGRLTTIVDGPSELASKFSQVGSVIHAKGICHPLWWWRCESFRAVLSALRSSDAVILHSASGRHVARLASIGRKMLPLIGVGHNDSRIKNHGHYDFIIAINHSQFMKLDAIRSSSSIRVIRNPLSVANYPVDIEQLVATRAARGKLIVGCIANLIPKKNIPYAISQFNKLIDLGKTSMHGFLESAELWIFGDGPLRKELEEAASSGRYGNRIHFKGFVEDRSAIFGEIDVLWSPSLVEPFGLVMTESLYFGCPVFATPTDGASEIHAVAPSLTLCFGGAGKDLADMTIRHFQQRSTFESQLAFSLQAHREAVDSFGYFSTARHLGELFSNLNQC